MAATAENVSFDILLGGKVTPEVLKALKDMEERLKQFGATTRTVNAVMSRAYRETFEGMAKESHRASETMRENFKKAFEKIKEGFEKIHKASEKLHESFEKLTEPLKKMGEFFGISGVIGAVGAAVSIEELIKHGTEVYAGREEVRNTLAATLRGRGREDLIPGYREQVERLAQQAPIGYVSASDMLRKLAATGRFRGPEEAERMAKAIVAVSGGTRESAESAFAGYEKMLLSGKLMPKAVAGISRGSGFSVLQQMARDAGMAVGDLTKALSAKKGGIAPAEAMQMLNKAILELGEGKALPLLQARMEGMKGLFYRLGEDWENFLEKIGQIWSNVISPIANDINQWLDSINWEQTFSALIEKSKEWGQTIKNVMALVFDSPVIKRFQAMWDGFMQRLVGGDMYGPWVRAWDKFGEHVADKWHWERQLTPQGEKFMKEGAAGIENILNRIADFFQWIYNNGSTVVFWLKEVVKWFIVLKGIEIAISLIQFANAIISVSKALATGFALLREAGAVTETAAATTATGTAATTTATGTAAAGAGVIAGLTIPAILVTELHKRFGWFGQTGAEPETHGARQGLGTEGGAARGDPNPLFKSARQIAEEHQKAAKAAHDSSSNMLLLKNATDQTRKALQALQFGLGGLGGTKAETPTAVGKDQVPRGGAARGDPNPLFKSARQIAEEHQKAAKAAHDSSTNMLLLKNATDQARKSIEGHSPGLTPAIETATAELNKFVPAMQQATQAFQALQFGLGGLGGAGGIPGAAGPHETEYGPAVAGDQPGRPTYDWNSYHHIGAWPGTTGPLRAGDVALGYGAQAQYHVQPGQYFMTASGHWVRFADRSGSKDPYNIDYFKGALGGIVTRPTRALIGEAGPEAVLPLSRAGQFGAVNVTVNFGDISTGERDPRAMFREFAETIAAEVHRVIGDEHRRSAVI